MKKKTIFMFIVLVISLILFLGCSKNDNGNDDPFHSIEIVSIADFDTVSGTLVLQVETDTIPDYVRFEFDTFPAVCDSTNPYAAAYNITYHQTDDYSAIATGYWGEYDVMDQVFFFIKQIELTPWSPVVLNGDTLQDDYISRNDEGYVRMIALGTLYISDSSCLSGIEMHSASLETLIIFNNPLEAIDLSPLETCTNMRILWIYSNEIKTINLSPIEFCISLKDVRLNHNDLCAIDIQPLWDLPMLDVLYLQNNPLDSISCINVCDFDIAHPNCNVLSDCECDTL